MAGLFTQACADLDAGRLVEARAAFLRLLAVGPPGPPGPLAAVLFLHLGLVAQKEGKTEEAESCYRTALSHDPAQPDALNNLAVLLHAAGRRAEARPLYESLLQGAGADSAAAWSNYGALLREEKHFTLAEKAFAHAAEKDPRNPSLAINRAHLALETSAPPEAEAACRAALVLAPQAIDVRNNLALLLKSRGAYAEAEEILRTALAIEPLYPQTLSNLGALCLEKGSLTEATDLLDRAIATAPQSAAAHYNRALLLLTLGRFAEGWKELDWRWRPGMVSRAAPSLPAWPIPRWQGEDLSGKTLLVQTEQAFGDEILCARYAPLLKARGIARIIWVTRPPLESLMRSIPSIDRVILEPETEAARTTADAWVFAMSLPGIFQTGLGDFPPPAPPFQPDSARIARIYAPLPPKTPSNRRIGLIWAGKPFPPGRSIAFSALMKAFAGIHDAVFIALQREDEARVELQAFLEENPETPLIDMGLFIRDFADTAALLSQLDLLVTIDSAPAHLAGAMGIPGFVLLKHVPDWRWQLERPESPWFPSLHLLRQKTPGDWSVPLDTLATMLISGRKAP